MKKSLYGIPEKINLYQHNVFTDTYTVPRGLLQDFKDNLPEHEHKIKDATTQGVHIDIETPKMHLRDYQKEAYNAADKSGTIIAPAGSGKTVVGIALIEKFKRRTIWLCHSNDLLKQALDTYRQMYPEEQEVGIIAQGSFCIRPENKVIFALIQTLQTHTEQIAEFEKTIGLLILDEAHHVPSYTFNKVVSKFSCETTIGLTATPERKDGLTELIEAFIGPELIYIDRAELYLNNKLITPTLVPVYTDFISRLCLTTQDAGYHEITGELYNDYKRAQLCARTILSFADKGLVIVLSDSIEYAFKVKTLLTAATNLKVELIHGGTQQYKKVVCSRSKYNLMVMQGLKISDFDGKKAKIQQYTDEEYEMIKCTKDKRERCIQEARDGNINVLFATKLADEGLDIPNIVTVALISPGKGDESGTKNGSRLEQRVGRCMRTAPGKKEAFILDFVDYNSGILKAQWYTRRRTYKRLQIAVPDKQVKTKSVIDELFSEFVL